MEGVVLDRPRDDRSGKRGGQVKLLIEPKFGGQESQSWLGWGLAIWRSGESSERWLFRRGPADDDVRWYALGSLDSASEMLVAALTAFCQQATGVELVVGNVGAGMCQGLGAR